MPMTHKSLSNLLGAQVQLALAEETQPAAAMPRQLIFYGGHPAKWVRDSQSSSFRSGPIQAIPFSGCDYHGLGS